MSPRWLASIGRLAAVIATVSAAGQAAAGQVAKAAADTWTAPRTPWGDPDLEGIWDSKTITPLQRPDRFAGREFLTDEEAAQLEKEAADHPGSAERAEAAAEAAAVGAAPFVEDVVGSCLLSFNYSGTKIVRTKRSSLIVDPPDGKIPVLKPKATKKNATTTRPLNPARKGSRLDRPVDNGGAADNPEDRPTIDRCLGVSLPCLGGLCAFSRMVQSPGYLTIYYEQGHGGGAYRNIPLDGRPHVPQQIRQWLGNSVGRWEGDTLVVDTVNFTDKTNFRGSREHLHLIERFTRVGRDLIIYRVTVDDPTTFARRWTLEMTLTKADERKNQIFETACHEGNYSLTTTLAGARVLEKKDAAKQKGSRVGASRRR